LRVGLKLELEATTLITGIKEKNKGVLNGKPKQEIRYQMVA
jgi:hypothetical protein